jgi:hypothetical protein
MTISMPTVSGKKRARPIRSSYDITINHFSFKSVMLWTTRIVIKIFYANDLSYNGEQRVPSSEESNTSLWPTYFYHNAPRRLPLLQAVRWIGASDERGLIPLASPMFRWPASASPAIREETGHPGSQAPGFRNGPGANETRLPNRVMGREERPLRDEFPPLRNDPSDTADLGHFLEIRSEKQDWKRFNSDGCCRWKWSFDWHLCNQW